jgi:hypothetical protein
VEAIWERAPKPHVIEESVEYLIIRKVRCIIDKMAK